MSIGGRIRMARKLSGLSIKKMAALIGMDPDRLSKYERGVLIPDEKTILRIANAIDVNVEFFYLD